MTLLYDAQGKKIVPGKQDLTQVIAHIRRDPEIFNGFLTTVSNPDRVLSMKDGQPSYVTKGLELYEEMQRDSQIKSSLNRRFNAVLTRSRIVKPVKSLEKNKKAGIAADAFKENLERLFLQEVFRNILFCIWYGFSVQEMVWQEGEQWELLAINDIAQRRFLFDWDGQPRLITREHLIDGEELPPYKFVTIRYNTEGSNPYGHGLAQDLFWVWWFKRYGLKYWMVYLDKLGTPTTLGYHPRNAKDTEIDLVLESLGLIGQDAAIAVPEGFKVELLEATRNSSGDHQKLVDVCDSWISRLILGTSSGINEAKFGTQAQATVQVSSEHENVELDAGYLEYAVNTQIVPQWCLYNYGQPVLFEFEIDKERPENRLETAKAAKEEMQTIRGYVGMGLTVSQAEIREKLKLKEPQEDEPVLQAAKQPSASAEKDTEKEDGEDEEAEHAMNLCPVCGTSHNRGSEFGEWGDVIPYDQADADLLTIIKQTRQAADQEFAEGLSKLENRVVSFEDHQSAIDWLLDTAPGVFKNLAAAKLFSGLFFADLLGRYHVERELKDETYASAFDPVSYEADWTKGDGPLPPKEAIAFFKGKIPLKPAEFKQLSDVAKARGFSIAGVNNLELLFEVKELLTKSLEAGETFADFKKQLPEQLKKTVKKRHLETVYLQNTLTAYSVGRWQQMTSPAVQQSHPYFEYRAVGDSRTRPVHRALNGSVYPQGHEFWDSWWPPNGYRCRCRAIARTEEYIERKQVPVLATVPATVEVDGIARQVIAEPGFSSNVGKDYFLKDKQILKEIADLEPVKARTYRDYNLPKLSEMPARELETELAESYDHLKTKGLTAAEIEAHYKQVFRKSLNIPKNQSYTGVADFQDWEVIFHEQKLGHLLKKTEQERGRYLPALKEIIQDPDEVWVNGFNHRSKGMVLEKKYIRKLASGQLLIVEDVQGEWQFHNVFPDTGKLDERRSGLLMYKKAA